MEFADHGDLYEKINFHTKNGSRFSEDEIWSIVIQVTRGLKALHELKILHRDLKSANVFMFENGGVKLGDMNVSKMSRNMCKTQTGTPYYASP
jgi:NIMA (never in mitosis gene a)-related kinase